MQRNTRTQDAAPAGLAAIGGWSNEYEVSGIVMELAKGEDGKEKGTGTLFRAAKLGFDKEKKKIEIESLGYEPVRLTDIKREK
jgi:hypothetical protein